MKSDENNDINSALCSHFYAVCLHIELQMAVSILTRMKINCAAHLFPCRSLCLLNFGQ